MIYIITDGSCDQIIEAVVEGNEDPSKLVKEHTNKIKEKWAEFYLNNPISAYTNINNRIEWEAKRAAFNLKLGKDSLDSFLIEKGYKKVEYKQLALICNS